MSHVPGLRILAGRVMALISPILRAGAAEDLWSENPSPVNRCKRWPAPRPAATEHPWNGPSLLNCSRPLPGFEGRP
jgi:hypothetical protein